MKLEKIIFLDIDGVLITSDAPNYWTANEKCVERLQRILDETGAGIVVSSSWRNMHNIDLDVQLSKFGLRNFKLVGSTPSFANACRGEEIQAWLDNAALDCHFVILDDDDDVGLELKEFLFQTNYDEGLTEDISNKIIKFLKG